jgi:U3 small nucleolar RNA-associated protein 11
MTSSLRNSLHRRNHKERSQLKNRNRLGILEKHKDYVLRASDYHSKQERLKRLHEKAAQRNKDEFYFAMNRERTVVSITLISHRLVSLATYRAAFMSKTEEIVRFLWTL